MSRRTSFSRWLTKFEMLLLAKRNRQSTWSAQIEAYVHR